QKIWSPKITQQTDIFLSKYRFNYNLYERQQSEDIATFSKRNVIFDSGIGTEVSIDMKSDNILSIGYQYTLKDVAYAFLDSAELDFVLDTDKRVEKNHGVFTNLSYKNPGFIDFNIGARMNFYENLNAFRFEPRLYAYKQLNKYIKLQVTGEIKNQVISEIDETIFSDLSLENKIWRLSDGDTFPIINSLQLSAGILCNYRGWTADTDVYYKKVNGVTALALGFLNPLDSQFHIGEQHVLGADFFVKKTFSPFHTWFSYSVNRVESKYEGINNEEYFTSSNSIFHAVTTSVSYEIKGFQLALGWNWHTGKPFTEAFVVPTSNDLFFNEINTKRLPNYHRLDVSATYKFKPFQNKSIVAKIGFSIRNLYDKQNHLSREYVGNNNLNDPIQIEDHYSLGFTPNFLLKLTW
ncbi:MAG: hypothetical protein K0U54_10195, partial [Bacteroidetes bacterium]|nr:hypothetical protein [Bacteroidota bacterium]